MHARKSGALPKEGRTSFHVRVRCNCLTCIRQLTELRKKITIGILKTKVKDIRATFEKIMSHYEHCNTLMDGERSKQRQTFD